jgi:hypothetical protein
MYGVMPLDDLMCGFRLDDAPTKRAASGGFRLNETHAKVTAKELELVGYLIDNEHERDAAAVAATLKMKKDDVKPLVMSKVAGIVGSINTANEKVSVLKAALILNAFHSQVSDYDLLVTFEDKKLEPAILKQILSLVKLEDR